MGKSRFVRAVLCVALVATMTGAGAAGPAAAGGSGWRWLNPQPSGDTINAVSMSPTAGSSCLWVVGDHGLIQKTFDYGASWHKFTPSGMTGTPDLTDIDLVADSVGWAVGANGTIVKISDGWNVTAQTAPVGTGHLYGVDAISTTAAVAVGEGGVVIRTTNGTSWETVWPAYQAGYQDFKAVVALSPTHFWVAGTGNTGGNNIFFFSGSLPYNKSTADTDFDVEDLAVDPATNTLWAVGRDRSDGSALHYWVTDPKISTADNEALFYAPTPPMPAAEGYLTGIARLDASHTWVTTSAGQVLFYDGTNPWSLQSHSYPNSTWLNDVDFRSGSGGQYQGAIVGDNGAMAATQSGGAAWTTRASSTNEPLMGVDFVSTSVGYVTADSDVLKTTDSGASWSALGDSGSSSLLDVDFKDTGKGWAVGRAGTAYYYNGSSWTLIDSGMSPGRDLYSVCYIDATNIWVCGDVGTIAKSTGTSWTMSSDADVTSGLWRSIDFFDTQRGIAVGDGGAVVYTTDGGLNWSAGASGIGTALYAVDMVSATTGYLVGVWSDGAHLGMKKTTDGGATWTWMTAPAGVSYETLKGVSFADASNGWIVGSNGMVFRTADGGSTWVKENISANWWNAVSAVSANAAWVVGDGGCMLTNYSPPPPPAKTVVYRFYNMKNGTHFYTSSYQEKMNIIKTWPDVYKYEGVGYEYDSTKAAQPLYRFYNKVNGSHFYTVSVEEKNRIIAKWPKIYTYEGPAYNVSSTPVGGGIVYRFYNVKTGSHFFTASAAERDTVIAKWPGVFTYEGEAYYLPM